MASTDTKFNISSRAITQLGGNAISAFDGASLEARLAEEHYQIIYLELLSNGHWGFAQSYESLATTGVPKGRYEFKYGLPADYLAVRTIEPPADYELRGAEIHTNVTTPILLDYTRRVAETDLPIYFVAALVEELTAKFAFPLTRSTEIADYWSQRSAIKLGESRFQDSVQFPPKSPRALDEFIACRY